MRGRSGACVAGACMAGEHAWWGAWHGVCVHGRGMHGGGHARGRGMRGRRDGHCSRRYASYWNASLFRYLIILWEVEVLIEIAVCCLIFSN